MSLGPGDRILNLRAGLAQLSRCERCGKLRDELASKLERLEGASLNDALEVLDGDA